MADAATAQGGVVSLEQLLAAGFTRGVAAERSRRGLLHRVHRGVYAVGHRALERPALLRAALLACGDGAVVSHATAAAHWGLTDRWPVLIDVTVPVEAGRKLDGIRSRRCRYPHPTEVGVHRGVLCTTPARTLVDQAGSLGTASLRKQVERAVVLKLLEIDALDLALARARGRRGVRALRAIADEWHAEDGSVPDLRSVFEARVLPQLLAAGLPRPACNQRIPVDGAVLTADFVWPDHGLIVETDGRETHETTVAFQRDRGRDQLLLAEGYRVARVTWLQMRDDVNGVIARLTRSLSAGRPGSGASRGSLSGPQRNKEPRGG